MPDALTGFCKTDFWDLNVTWYTDIPNFTECFKNTLLVWVPFGFLFLTIPFEIYEHRKPGRGYIPWNIFNILKLISVTALFALVLTELIWVTNYISPDDYSDAVVMSPAIRLVGYFVVFLMIYYGRKNGVQSSIMLFYFWLFQFLASVIIYYSKIVNLFYEPELENVTVFGLHLAMMPLVFLQFLLTFISDQYPVHLKYYITENICPEKRSSYLSQIVFGWLDSLIVSGYKAPLKQNELWSLDPRYRSQALVDKFDYHWAEEMQKAKASGWDVTNRESINLKGVYHPSFMFALIKCYWSSFLFGVLQKTCSDLLAFVSPLMLDKIITHVSSDEPVWMGIFYAAVVFFAAELNSLFLSQYFLRMYTIAMKVRMAIISAVYRKALKISNKERQESTVGEIVNLMSIDTQRFVDLMPYVIMLYSAPLQISLSLYLLSETLGISVVAGVGVMILLAPANAIIATVARKLQIKDMMFKDERTKLMNEILNGVKVLKLYAWEIPFGDMVQVIRDKEVDVLKKMAYYMAGIGFIWTCAPFFVSLASFTMYVLIDEKNILTANIAFVSLSLFNLLRFPLNMLPQLITGLIQVSVSIKRLNKFLRGEELDSELITHHKLGDDAIVVEDGDFAWGGIDERPTLSDINLHVPKGKLYAVVGQVGCGKSSLVSSVLGELNKRKGKINIQGSVAYIPQQAWIQNASVRDNILMYKKFNQSYYDNVLDACTLKTDLEILPGGDKTEIGEKGINLSGGQKQRVSLARAVYHDSDIYLLDDPLSAVDSHVGKHIFENVIGPKGLLKSKTRLFVTNGISYLPQCDMVIVLKDGIISEMGTYNELLSSKGAFSDFLMQYLSQEDQDLDQEDLEQLDTILSKVPVSPDIQRQISKRLSESESESVLSKSSETPIKRRRSTYRHSLSERSITPKKQADSKIKLTQAETMETAEVKIAVYISYLREVGIGISIVVILLWIISQVASVGSNVWLSEWSNDPVLPDGTVDPALRDMRLGVYGALGVAQGLGVMLGAFGLAYGSMKAANHLHRQMLDCILKSPMSFFDTTPIGRIVNRFSKDVNVMDVNLMMNFRGWVITLMQVISVIIVDAIETPLILVILVPCSFIYYFVQKVYIATSRQLKRLESVTRSPIYVHFSESVTGAPSIRAYGVEDIFTKEIYKRVDTNMICYYPSIAANRWLAVRLEFVGNLIVLFAALFAVLSRGLLDPGSVGLSVSYAMSITSSLNWMVRMSSELETNIVSVERILEYSSLEPEAEWDNDFNRNNRSWPETGKIEFNSYKTRYRKDLDLVLKGVNCNVEPGEKVGICGRTGAGKSSLTLALFRIIEAAGGSISIDDVDISKLGLHNLRSRLTIIPQDPVLFSGNLRQNLDPFLKQTDEEIYSALEHAHLKNYVNSLPDGLNHTVAEGGENLSVGQRQLVCLARALLRKTKILILDEATAAVDLETDDLIQDTIRKEFADCTVLTIAHRLNTIMDNSRILVLDQGDIAEFDTPQNLLQNKNSIFYGMAKDAGLI